jgi:hypothetical protein
MVQSKQIHLWHQSKIQNLQESGFIRGVNPKSDDEEKLRFST